MNEHTARWLAVFRYSVAGILFLIVGIRFFSIGDHIGTAIYGVTATWFLLAAFIRMWNQR